MKWHPDRNVGQEDAARAAFQEIRDAYAILSDEAQRKVYDAVYDQEMRRWDALQRRQQEVEAARARKAQAAAEAKYSQMVGVAMRFADEGHNRDVLFGVLLGRDCDADTAQRIADSVWALQESRRAEEERPPHAGPAAAKHDKPSHEPRPAGLFDSLWQGFFGVRS